MTEMSKGNLFSCGEAGLTVWYCFWFPHFVLSCSPPGCKFPHTAHAGLKRNIGSSYYPRLVNNPVRKCLWIDMSVYWRMAFVALKPALYETILHFLNSMACERCSASHIKMPLFYWLCNALITGIHSVIFVVLQDGCAWPK